MRFAIGALLLVLVSGCADHRAPASSPSDNRRSPVSETSVRSHLEFLASDALNGRQSATRDEQIAAEYVAAQFRRLELAPPDGTTGGFVQSIPFTRTPRGGQAVSATTYKRSDLGTMLASRGARLVQDPHPAMNFFQRSDNYTMAVEGVIAHTVSSYGLHKEYHQPLDETRAIDYAHMTESIASMVEPLAWLANSTFTPAWKPGMKPQRTGCG